MFQWKPLAFLSLPFSCYCFVSSCSHLRSSLYQQLSFHISRAEINSRAVMGSFKVMSWAWSRLVLFVDVQMLEALFIFWS